MLFIIGIFFLSIYKSLPIGLPPPSQKLIVRNISPDDPRLLSNPRAGLLALQQITNDLADYVIQAYFIKAELFSVNNKNFVVLTLKQESNPQQKNFSIALPKDLESIGGQRKLKPSVFLEKNYQRIKLRLRYKSDNISSTTFFRLDQLLEWEPYIFYVYNENELF